MKPQNEIAFVPDPSSSLLPEERPEANPADVDIRRQNRQTAQAMADALERNYSVIEKYDIPIYLGKNHALFRTYNQTCYNKIHSFFYNRRALFPVLITGLAASATTYFTLVYKSDLNVGIDLALSLANLFAAATATAGGVRYYRNCRYPDVTLDNTNTQRQALEDFLRTNPTDDPDALTQIVALTS